MTSRVIAAVVAAALIGCAGPTRPLEDDRARGLCDATARPAATASLAFAALRGAFEDAVRPEAERAIGLACREVDQAADAGERLRARLDLASALVYRSGEADAIALLDPMIATLETAAPPLPAALAEASTVRAKALLSLRRLDRAVPDLEAARRHERDAGLDRTLLAARTLVALADARHQQRRLDEADRALDEADAILLRLGAANGRDAADVLGQRTMIAYERQDFPETLRLAERDIDARRAIGGPDDGEQLDPLATIVAIRSMQGDHAGSIAAAREALRIAALHADASIDNRLGIVQNLATTYVVAGQPQQALPVAEEALALRANTTATRRRRPCGRTSRSDRFTRSWRAIPTRCARTNRPRRSSRRIPKRSRCCGGCGCSSTWPRSTCNSATSTPRAPISRRRNERWATHRNSVIGAVGTRGCRAGPTCGCRTGRPRTDNARERSMRTATCCRRTTTRRSPPSSNVASRRPGAACPAPHAPRSSAPSATVRMRSIPSRARSRTRRWPTSPIAAVARLRRSAIR